MKKHSYLCVLILLILISSDVNASDSYFMTKNQNTVSDSIILKKRNSDKIKVIKTGEKIKLWEINKDPVIGNFKSVQNDQIEIIINGKTTIIQKNKIVRIQVFSNKKQKNIGWIIVLLGIIVMVYVGFVGAAIGGLMGSKLLAILFGIISSLPGLGIVKLGNTIKARRFKIGKKWKIL